MAAVFVLLIPPSAAPPPLLFAPLFCPRDYVPGLRRSDYGIVLTSRLKTEAVILTCHYLPCMQSCPSLLTCIRACKAAQRPLREAMHAKRLTPYISANCSVFPGVLAEARLRRQLPGSAWFSITGGKNIQQATVSRQHVLATHMRRGGPLHIFEPSVRITQQS